MLSVRKFYHTISDLVGNIGIKDRRFTVLLSYKTLPRVHHTSANIILITNIINNTFSKFLFLHSLSARIILPFIFTILTAKFIYGSTRENTSHYVSAS